MRCPADHGPQFHGPLPESDPGPDDDPGGDGPWIMIPERNRPADPGELFGREMLVAELFLLEYQRAVADGVRLPEGVPEPVGGYFLPDPFGDRHVDYPTEPAFRASDPDPTVLVRGRYYTGSDGYAAALFAVAAAAMLGLGVYAFTSGLFQNLTSYMMGQYQVRPLLAAPAGSGYFFQAPTWTDQPGDFFDGLVATYTAGEQPANWYGGDQPFPAP